MPGQVRVGDTFQVVIDHGEPDCPHTVIGTWTTGSLDNKSNGLGMIRVGDIGIYECPHDGPQVATASIGSTLKMSANLGCHRIGDLVSPTCPTPDPNLNYSLTGSGDVEVG